MADGTGVRVEQGGPVTVVTIDRPERRNAVDGPAAAALADAFREFDRDPGASVAVLTGAGGAFCAGADLKAIAEGRPPGGRRRRRADGPDPAAPVQAGAGRDRGPGGGRRAGAGPLVRPAGGGRGPSWACSTAASGCR